MLTVQYKDACIILNDLHKTGVIFVVDLTNVGTEVTITNEELICVNQPMGGLKFGGP